MSVVTGILDRLSGVAVVRAKLDETLKRVDKVGDWLLDHERRLVDLETHQKLLGARRDREGLTPAAPGRCCASSP